MENKATTPSLKSFRHSLLRAGLVGLAIVLSVIALTSAGARPGRAAAPYAPAQNPSPSPTPGATPGATPSPTPGATPSPTPGATPSPTPGVFEIEATLIGAPVNGVTPRGEAKHEVESGRREFEVEVRDVNLPRGTALAVIVDGAQVGTLVLDDQQRARLRLRTDEGQAVPAITGGTRVVVANQAGATLLAGSFSSSAPNPNPTPVPTPTPGSGGETRVEAVLAGAAIAGLTPRGEAELRLRDGGRREIRVEVEKVNLPAGTVLNVLIDNLLAGRITLNSQLEGRLELDTGDGQLVPQIQPNSAVVVTNQAGATLLSSTFNRPVAPITAANDIDDSRFFVEQQYKDFLDRLPDDSGLAFWVNQIAQCGGDQSCVSGARINTSGAFFLSIEFQETGYLLYRLNRASFGTMPRRAEFLIDMQRVAQGVVVGRAGWEQVLESNKQALVADWVNRPAFRAAFDAMTAEQFVDALFQRAGVVPTAAERNALVAGLTSGSLTRAAVLRRVAEHDVFTRQEKNAAFVLMQYFGYLHRDPDADGFQFWRAKLDNHGGDFHSAEMVKSFIVAGEYRDRFRW